MEEIWRDTSTQFMKAIKDHKCDPCGKSFTELSNLERHLHTVHDGYKDYKCESCSKAFSDKRNLKRHIDSVHNGQKDHK